MLLYHGSNIVVTKPVIRRSVRGLDFDGALRALKAYKLQDQYCFKTRKALGYRRCLRSYTMEG